MNSASAAIAPPPASSSRCGAALASARASSSVVNGALRLNWLPASSRRACERASRSSAPASFHPCSLVITSGASQLYVRYTPLSPGSDSNPATSVVTSTGVAPASDGTNPRGTAERSGAEPTTWIRTPIAARSKRPDHSRPGASGSAPGGKAPAGPAPRRGAIGPVGRSRRDARPLLRAAPGSSAPLRSATPSRARAAAPALVRHAGTDCSLPGDADLGS